MRCLMLIAAVTIASCAPSVTPPASDFARVTAGRTPGPAQSCISSNQAESLRVLDSATLAYGSGRTVYINHLGGPCPGIAPLSTLFVETQGTQYCRGDRVRGREIGAIIPGPSCLLGDWVPYRTP
jgi:hypothetical protein